MNEFVGRWRGGPHRTSLTTPEVGSARGVHKHDLPAHPRTPRTVSSCTRRPPRVRLPLQLWKQHSVPDTDAQASGTGRGRASRLSTSQFFGVIRPITGFGPTSTRPIAIRDVRSGAAYEHRAQPWRCARLNLCAGQDIRIIRFPGETDCLCTPRVPFDWSPTATLSRTSPARS
jgi:hypothetical protein